MEREIWLPVDEVRGYEVSNLGRVRNEKTGRVLIPNHNGREVLLVNLSHAGYSISRPVKKLVAEAFVPKAPFYDRRHSCVIRHIDEDWMNCRADNLNFCLRGDAAFIKRRGVPWGRPVIALTTGDIYRDTVDAARHYEYGCDISILKICMEQEGWHCGETFRWA